MMKWIAGIVIAVVIVAGIGLYLIMKGPDLSKYEYLKDPQISEKPDQTMLVVEAKGDPNVVAGKAFGLLFSTYYKLRNNQKSFGLAPRARWSQSILTTNKEDWVGRYALPVSPGAKLPDKFKIDDPDLKVSIVTWKYGTVAEILHIGAYSEEPATVKNLLDFIEVNGYRVSGDHEEEYLRGPGMFGKGDPNQYYTIIRYTVFKP